MFNIQIPQTKDTCQDEMVGKRRGGGGGGDRCIVHCRRIVQISPRC